jgi:hypothetical protein
VNGSCFWFQTDRAEGAGALDGDSTNDPAGGFRRRSATVSGTEVGWIEMYTGATAPDCNEADGANGWVAVTDPESMNITAFTVDDSLSYTQVVLEDVNGNTMSQRVRKLRMAIRGQLVMDPTIVRRVEDIISVRNDLIL